MPQRDFITEVEKELSHLESAQDCQKRKARDELWFAATASLLNSA